MDAANKPSRLIVGLMSGTSVDGIDSALVRVHGQGLQTRVETLGFLTAPFSPELREAIHAGFSGDAPALCELNFVLGEAFATAALEVAEQAGVKISEVDAVASPGQTIYHIDPTQGPVPSTLQLGESAVIAERTGCLVVSDFRTRDIAAGGSGAPLVPYVDYILFARPERARILQNIGGIANLTLVPPAGRPQELIAFDTGPGNMIIDELAKELQDDDEAIDRDGRLSALGRVDEALLAELMSHPYMGIEPPKSTGRELFGAEFCRELVERHDPKQTLQILTTVVHFTARSILDSYERFIFPRYDVDEVIISGGGRHNQTLMAALRAGLEPRGIALKSWEDLKAGFSGDAKEAVAFAVLANETLQGLPSGCPAATGASRSVIQGKITL